MIERIYADNFRTLVNFEVKPGTVSLLLGPNGSGKSSVFDVVEAIKRFVGGVGLTSELFPSANLTRWETRDEQTFEIDLRSDTGLYRYSLKVQHEAERRRSLVASEQLALDGKPLFTFTRGKMQLFDDRHKPGPELSFDWTRSGLSAIFARGDNRKLTEFKQRLAKILFLRPCPPMMATDSTEETEELNRTGANFPSWYRYVQRQDISVQLRYLAELRQVIDGFESLKLEGPADSTVTLRVLIRPSGGKTPLSYKFGELSDGQRQLIILYALLYALSDDHRVLFLDEPDNYLGLREVEPWLTTMMDAAGRGVEQAVVLSHHPEVIDHLAPEKGVWLTRESAGPTRVDANKARDTAPLKPSEAEARGW